MNKSIRTALAASTLAMIATPVAAEDVTVTIDYSDLDLSQSRDQNILDLRLDRAIDSVCGRISTRSLSLNDGVSECRVAVEKQARVIVARNAEKPAHFARTIKLTVRS